MFWPICPPAFFRCLSTSRTFMELRTMSFIESTGVACSDSVSHNRVQVFLHCYSPAVKILLVQSCLQANRIRTGDPRGFNKGRSSKFCEGSRVWQTPEEGQRTYRPKRCGKKTKDEDNSLKTLNEKNFSCFHISLCGSKIWNNSKTFFLVWLVQFLKKKHESKFSLLSLFQLFFNRIQSNMSEQEKKWQWIYDLLNTKTKPKKNFQKIGVFFMASIKLRPETTLIMLYGAF